MFALFLVFHQALLQEQDQVDGVNLYARELLTLSLAWHFFHDATREGTCEFTIDLAT